MRAAARTLVLCVGLLALTEVGLRLADRGPWRPFQSFEQLPTISQAHPVLGWTNLPGRYEWPSERGVLEVGINPDGTRGVSGSGRAVHTFGGSWTFGYGLADDEIWTSRLRLLRPELALSNHGVPGYGTLQSALLAEGVEVQGSTVIYGFVELHEGRNAGARGWLHALERSARGNAWAATPWARWDGERLDLHPPTHTTHWSWSERLALVYAAERAWIGLLDRFSRTKAETTAQLMKRFGEDVEARGGVFKVALLDLPTRAAFYERRLAELGIEVIDLRDPSPTLQPDGHPDAHAHRVWAQRLAEVL